MLGGSKGGLFGTLHSDYSSMAAALVMSRLAKMSARHMGNRGFSIGIDDVTPRQVLLRIKAATIGENYSKCDDYITQYKKVGGGVLGGGPAFCSTIRCVCVRARVCEGGGASCSTTLAWVKAA